MKKWPLSRWALVGVAGAVLLVIAVSATSQGQQRVQTTTQLTVRTPVVAGPLVEWEKHYPEAMNVASELAESGSLQEARRLADDFEDVDRALRDYVRAAERLRHKNRALVERLEILVLQNNIQEQSRQYQTLLNALTASHQAEMNSIINAK